VDTMDMAGREPAGLVAASPLGWFIDPRRTHFGTTGAAGTASASVCLHLWTLTERARGGPIGHSYEGRVTQRVGAFCLHRLP
jgi:hypothetical protein